MSLGCAAGASTVSANRSSVPRWQACSVVIFGDENAHGLPDRVLGQERVADRVELALEIGNQRRDDADISILSERLELATDPHHLTGAQIGGAAPQRMGELCQASAIAALR